MITVKNIHIGAKSKLSGMLKKKGLTTGATELDLDARINVFIGKNGSGKTTFLNYLKEAWMPGNEDDEESEGTGLLVYDDKPTNKDIEKSAEELDELFSYPHIGLAKFTGISHLDKSGVPAPAEGIMLHEGTYKRLVNNGWIVLCVYESGYMGGTLAHKSNADKMVAVSVEAEPRRLSFYFPANEDKILALDDIIRGKMDDPSYRKRKFQNHSIGEIQINVLKEILDFYQGRQKPAPNLILFDELAAGLSPEHQRLAGEYLTKISKTRTKPQIFLATHSHLVLAKLPSGTIITDLNIDQNKGKLLQYRRGDLSNADVYKITGNKI